jgi:magnesium and cobalt transporter
VVNEYGGVSGIVTIEDVLEEIVGEIEDEFDTDDEAFIQPQVDGCFQVSAMTPLNDFNEHFDTHLPCERVDTLGGWVMQALERIPKVGDSLNAESLTIEVTHANRRCVTQLKVTPHEA